MILSVSRRTDIPALYWDWFLARLRAGEALVRNPFSPRQVSRLLLSPDTVDGIVFWSKDPRALPASLDALAPYPFYLQFTLTAYGPDAEPGLPPKPALEDGFLRLAEALGPGRVLWRYDPVFLTARYTADWHAAQFARLARKLRGATGRCTVSFLDFYRNTAARMAPLGLVPLDGAGQRHLLARFAPAARAAGMRLCTCAEAGDFSGLGVEHGACVDAGLLGRLGGWPLDAPRDKNQRPACGCAQSVDLGVYNTCTHGCLYCYAVRQPSETPRLRARYDPQSPLLCGRLAPGDAVKTRAMPAFRRAQIHF